MEKITFNITPIANDALNRQMHRLGRNKTDTISHSLVLVDLLYNDFINPENSRLTLIDCNGKEVTIYII